MISRFFGAIVAVLLAIFCFYRCIATFGGDNLFDFELRFLEMPDGSVSPLADYVWVVYLGIGLALLLVVAAGIFVVFVDSKQRYHRYR